VQGEIGTAERYFIDEVSEVQQAQYAEEDQQERRYNHPDQRPDVGFEPKINRANEESFATSSMSRT